MVIDWSSNSPVTEGIELTILSFFELCFNKKIEMLLGNWINGTENVPVDILGTWWGCDGSLVHPALVAIHHLHEVSIKDVVRNNGVTIGIPLETIKESGEDVLLGD